MNSFTGMVKSIKIKTCLLGAGLLMIAGWSFAQTPLEELEVYRNKFPNESGVFTQKWKEIDIQLVADSLQISVESFEEILVLQNPSIWVKDKVYSSSFSYVDEVDAYTLVPGKKKYKKVEVAEFKRSFDRDSYVFYDDTELISFVYPEVEVGSKVVNHYEWNTTQPRLLSKFYFSSYSPVESAQFRLVADAGVDISYHLFNDELANIETNVYTNEAGRQVYEFTASDVKKVEYEEDNPDFSYLTPVGYFRIDGYKDSNGNYQQILGSLDDLHTWYRTFLTGLEDTAPLKDLVNEVVSPDDSDLEKIKKVFYWVQENVRYIAFEQGMRGFVPHPAQYVYNKRYGDCKDMSSLLVGALRSCGVDANFTWIGSRNLPYGYSEVPSPIVDDHMIASVEIDGKRIFLDATGSYTPLGFPTSMIQGKEAFISLGEDEYQVTKVPVVDREQNLMVDTSYVSFKDGDLIGTGSMQLSGLVKVANTYKLITKTSSGEEKYLRRLLSKGSNKFLLGDYEVSHVDDLDRPIEISYDFTVGDYFKEIGDELYVNPYLDKSLVGDQLEDRKTPRENDYQYINRSSVVLELPEGYQVDYLPEDQQKSWNHFGYELKHQLEDNRVVVTKEFYVNYLLLSPDSFNEWNEGIKAYSKALRNTIILKRND